MDNLNQENKKTSGNKVLFVLIALLVLVSALAFTYFFFRTNIQDLYLTVIGNNPSVEESIEPVAVTAGSVIPNLSKNAAYIEAERLRAIESAKVWEEQDMGPATVLYERAAAEAMSGDERAQALFMAATTYRRSDPVGAVARFKELVADNTFDNTHIKAGAVEQIYLTYTLFPTVDVFDAIFSGEYEQYHAPKDAKPSQIDISLTNLLTFASSIYPLASVEMRLANATLDNMHATEIPMKLIEYCRERYLVTPDGLCVPEVSRILTISEQKMYAETSTYVRERLKNAEVDMERLKRDGELVLLGRALTQYAKIKNKGLLYDTGTPDEVVKAHEDAIEFTKEHNFLDLEAGVTLNYAIFLRFWWWSEEDLPSIQAKMVELLSQFYETDRFDSTEMPHILRQAYESELETHSIATAMVLRGPVAAADADPAFRSYLIEEIGWDFENPVISRFYEE